MESLYVVLISLAYLVHAPEQLVGLLVDTGVHKVHVVVLDAEVEIAKPEDQPVVGSGEQCASLKTLYRSKQSEGHYTEVYGILKYGIRLKHLTPHVGSF